MKGNYIKRVNRLLVVMSGLIITDLVANAEVTTDGTVGPTAILSGPNFDINETLGTQSGSNLFHSFSTFNINTGESATFSGPNSVSNIVGRVTGGAFSNIDGAVNSTIPGANLWLVNPNGLVFGGNASINVMGSFHASTADNVNFDDGAVFGTEVINNPILSVANPVGFGFVSTDPASIIVNNSGLSVPTGETLSLVGGDVSLISAALSAVDGRVNIAAVNGPGDVTFVDPAVVTESGIDTTGVTSLADITLTDSTVTTSGDGGGDIYIAGGVFVLDPTSLIENNSVDTDGGVIHISGTDVTFNEGIVTTETDGTGKGADIVVKGRNLTVNNNASPPIFTGIISEVETNGTGDGGNVFIEMSDTVSVEREGVIRSLGRNNAVGGDIDINAKDLQVVSGGKIFTDTFFGGGTSGDINITTTDSVLVSGAGSKLNSQTFGSSGVGATNVGLNITTSAFTIDDQAQVSSDSFNDGFGAAINIVADNVTVSNSAQLTAQTFDETGGGINITASETLAVTSDGKISTDTFNDGAGSDININASNVLISNGGRITAGTKRNGQAGAINVVASNAIRVSGRNDNTTGFFSESGDPDPFFQDQDYNGRGGDVNLNAREIVFENGSIASSSAINSGNAGNINIDVSDKLQVLSSEFKTSAAKSAGGNVNIQAVNLVYLLDSQITAEAFGVTPGNDGGNIFIDPVNVVLNSSSLIARANAGNGGNINIISTAFLRTPDSLLDATSQTGIDGEVLIETLNQSVDVAPIEAEPFLDLSSILSNRCAAHLLKSRSSFTIDLHRGGGVNPTNFNYHGFGKEIGIIEKNYNVGFSTFPVINLACR